MRSTREASWRARLRPSLLLLGMVVALGACRSATPPPPADPTACDVAAVGDSLTVGVEPYLAKALSGRGCRLEWIDGKGSRRTAEGVQVLNARAAANQLPNVLIVGLGTNDRYHQQDFAGHVDRVMQLANGRKVIWIELAYDPVKVNLNAILRSKDRQYPNLSIMAWDHRYWSTPSWRASDGIHATRAGYAARAGYMADMAQAVVK